VWSFGQERPGLGKKDTPKVNRKRKKGCCPTGRMGVGGGRSTLDTPAPFPEKRAAKGERTTGGRKDY